MISLEHKKQFFIIEKLNQEDFQKLNRLMYSSINNGIHVEIARQLSNLSVQIPNNELIIYSQFINKYSYYRSRIFFIVMLTISNEIKTNMSIKLYYDFYKNEKQINIRKISNRHKKIMENWFKIMTEIIRKLINIEEILYGNKTSKNI